MDFKYQGNNLKKRNVTIKVNIKGNVRLLIEDSQEENICKYTICDADQKSVTPPLSTNFPHRDSEIFSS